MLIIDYYYLIIKSSYFEAIVVCPKMPQLQNHHQNILNYNPSPHAQGAACLFRRARIPQMRGGEI